MFKRTRPRFTSILTTGPQHAAWSPQPLQQHYQAAEGGEGGSSEPPADPAGDGDKDDAGKDDAGKDDAGIDWKAMARKHEATAKANAAAAKKLADLERKNMTDAEKAAADRAAAEEATKAAEKERDEARAELARVKTQAKYGLADKHMKLLRHVPADELDSAAKELAAEVKPGRPPGPSGGEHKGGGDKPKPTTLAGAVAAHYT